MFNHYFNPSSGAFVRTTHAYPGSIQSDDCIRSETRIEPKEGFWPVLNTDKNGFDYVENHIGESWFKDDGMPVIIDFLGDPAEQGYLKDQPEAKETEKIYVVSAAQAKIALLETASPITEAESLLDLVEWIIANCSRKTQIWFDNASNWISNDENVVELASQIGLSEDQVIGLFKKAEQI